MLMIKVNEEFSFGQDTHCWVLEQHVHTTNKKAGGEPTVKIKKTYPGSLTQVLTAIIERTQYDATDAKELLVQVQLVKDDVVEVGMKIRAALAKRKEKA